MYWQQWQDVLADKSLRDLPYKIELTQYGKIEMSPPVSLSHSHYQGTLAFLLRMQLGGESFTELPIITEKGVKVPDVAWGSKEYYQLHKNDIAATSAPEICIEIMSPSNTKREMKSKVNLYLKAGATEVWIMSEAGTIQYFDKNGQKESSGFDVKIDSLV
jgi:Uma2 family endonuclease